MAGTIYRKELKDFLRQQAQTGLTITELKEQCCCYPSILPEN